MNNLLFSFNIVMPMAILMLMGYIFKQIGMFTEVFITQGKKLCFYVLLSCSLFKNLYDSSLDSFPIGFISFVVIAILVEFVISLIAANLIADRKNQKGVIIQGATRSNFAYLGIPLATMMFSDPELIGQLRSEISLASIFVIPVFNIVSVCALAYYSDKNENEKILKRTFKGLISNPCIDSILLGLFVLMIRSLVPSVIFLIKDRLSFIYTVLSYLSSMSTPFAFLLVGASLDFSHSITNLKKLVYVVGLRIVIFPLLILSAAYFMNIASQVEYAILVSVFASPTAVASAIMASELGGDSDLANEIVIYSTTFSIISLLLVIFVLRTVGCL